MSIHFPEKSVFMCAGNKCGKHKDVRKFIKEAIKQHHAKDRIEVFKMECSDRCKHAPVLCVQPDNKWYSDVSIADAEKIVQDLLS
jgi:(2Fe-2S) ferredoxin